MNNKEFITALSQRTGYKVDDTQSLVRTVVHAIVDSLTEGDSVGISGLGTFEVRKRMERISTNPGTGQYILVRPDVVRNFHPFPTLKERMRSTK